VGKRKRDEREGSEMIQRIDEAKGRTKEAAGDLADNPELKREGKIDRATSTAKEKIDEVADKVKDRVGVGRDRNKRSD
jgi:uncharacterized protein YjbJ (UPF0337 family)